MMVKDKKAIKKKVASDWQTAFPQLAAFAQDKFYKIIGPLVVGIELINIQRIEGYRPHFMIYPLWGNNRGHDLKACLDAPAVYSAIRNRKGLQLDIPYIKHGGYFAEAVECTKTQISIP